MAGVECLVLGSFIAAAAAGSACIGSVGEPSWTGSGMKAAGRRGRSVAQRYGAVRGDSCGAGDRRLDEIAGGRLLGLSLHVPCSGEAVVMLRKYKALAHALR